MNVSKSALNETKPNQTKPNQTKQNQTKPNKTKNDLNMITAYILYVNTIYTIYEFFVEIIAFLCDYNSIYVL